jgi:hypothetical protein
MMTRLRHISCTRRVAVNAMCGVFETEPCTSLFYTHPPELVEITGLWDSQV